MSVTTYVPIGTVTPGITYSSPWTVEVRMEPVTVRAECRQEYVKLEDYEALEKKNRDLKFQVEALLYTINSDNHPRLRAAEKRADTYEIALDTVVEYIQQYRPK